MTGEQPDVNTIVVLGPTASGKTRLGVGLASTFGGEVISADSRQVYRGLDIGSGKDLDEYRLDDGTTMPYHLIDVVGLDQEFSVFEFQRRFFELFEQLRRRQVLGVVVGGSGLYLEAAVAGYQMVDAPENPSLRAELASLSDDELVERLDSLRGGQLHNTTDSLERGRLLRAIEVAVATASAEQLPAPEVAPFVLGTRFDRQTLRSRIDRRLRQRLREGLIEEVQQLRAANVSWERLHSLGLEYRFVGQYLKGEIRSKNDLAQKLGAAIGKFAKRQDTWFRRMERAGTRIHWLDGADEKQAEQLVRRALDR